MFILVVATQELHHLKQGKEATWVNQVSLYGRSQLKIDLANADDSGNFTCVMENREMLDNISYSLRIEG